MTGTREIAKSLSSKRWGLLLCCALAPLACGAALTAVAPRSEGPPHCRIGPGERIPPEIFDRIRPQIEEMDSQPFIIGFFLTWAPTFEASIKAMNKACAEGVAVVGITPRASAGPAGASVPEPDFPVIEDADMALSRGLGVEVFPTFITAQTDGKIISVSHSLSFHPEGE